MVDSWFLERYKVWVRAVFKLSQQLQTRLISPRQPLSTYLACTRPVYLSNFTSSRPMSNQLPPLQTSPSESPKPNSKSQPTSAPPGDSKQRILPSEPGLGISEAPQSHTGLRSQSLSNLLLPSESHRSSSDQPDSTLPAHLFSASPVSSTESPKEAVAATEQQFARPDKPSGSRTRAQQNWSQPKKTQTAPSPYSRPRSKSQPRGRSRPAAITAMSSAASSPSNTSTTGPSGSSSTGSNPSYHLPYAPFPYPMPPNYGGSGTQGGHGGSSGSGK
ncbi:hypothetical protein BU24DRAFT_46702 [Aaosphaeria arxii CBS 175.79]|uniref:Uncharacterized protein n=1 Tax=Aaosphaeria arxii CBS 175.79 TaxID=1450172 RepID=A0A6A5XD42_9PLEO|nr:uncharacterized protein BU24DRAFT_46702 [Aaosphaeria arxii CBS 175.79]KAF2010821.1 hypothetical protein BU24DRAFT_46702 [Aaosphaeria arxii CBS 175.79]